MSNSTGLKTVEAIAMEAQDAEISRLRAELATERRAVERLAGLADDCPPNWPCNWGRDDESCAMCRAAWARSKEVFNE